MPPLWSPQVFPRGIVTRASRSAVAERSNAVHSEKKPNDRSEMRITRKNFWATTGSATVLAAAIGAGATLLAKGSNTPAPEAAPVTQSTTAGEVQHAAPTSQLATTEAQPGVFWQGNFLYDNYVNFDTAPPQNQNGRLSQDVKGDLEVEDEGSAWTGTSPPTYQQCAYQVQTQAADSIPLDVGTQVCYQTADGRIVYFKVASSDSPGDGFLTNPRFEISVTVWNR
jgi:hypothetical protein